MSEYLRQILEHASSQGYRSNAIKPLIGGVIICFVLSIIAFYINALIIVYFLIGFGSLFSIGWLFAYFFCLFKDPNLLRSEKYNLEKTAIEKATMFGETNNKRVEINMPPSDYVIEYSESRKIEK